MCLKGNFGMARLVQWEDDSNCPRKGCAPSEPQGSAFGSPSSWHSPRKHLFRYSHYQNTKGGKHKGSNCEHMLLAILAKMEWESNKRTWTRETNRRWLRVSPIYFLLFSFHDLIYIMMITKSIFYLEISDKVANLSGPQLYCLYNKSNSK